MADLANIVFAFFKCFCCIYAIIDIKHDFVIPKHSQDPGGSVKNGVYLHSQSLKTMAQDHANINEGNIMFDPSVIMKHLQILTYLMVIMIRTIQSP